MAKKKGVSWVFDLVDKVTGPAKAAGASFDELARKAKSLLDIKKKLGSAWSIGRIKGGSGGRRGGRGAFFGGAAKGAGQGLGAALKGGGEGLGGALSGGTGILQLDALMGIGGRLFGFAQAVGGMAVAMGHFAIETASAKTALAGSFELLLKSKEAAAGVVAQITKLAAETPFEQADVSKVIKQLVGAGFEANRAFDIFRAFGDVAAFNNFDTDVLNRMAEGLSKIRGLGKFNLDKLQELAMASGGALTVEDFARNLDPKKTVKQVTDMLSKGQVTIDKGTDAILESIRQKFGGQLGGMMAKMANEIPGLMSTLKDNLGAGLIPSVDENQGFSAVREMLRSLVKASDRAGPFLKESLGALFDVLFGTVGGLGGEGGQAVFEAIFASVGRGIRQVTLAIEIAKPYMQAFAYGLVVGLIAVRDALKPVFAGMMKAFGSQGGANAAERFGEAMVMAGRTVGVLVAATAVLFGALVVFSSWLGTNFLAALGAVWNFFVRDLPAAFRELGEWLSFLRVVFEVQGTNIVDGLWNGIKSGWATLIKNFEGLVALLPTTVKKALGIASPSKVFAELGMWSAAGFQVGLEGGQPGVRAAMADVVTPLSPTRSLAGAGPGAGAAITVTVGDVIVNAPAGSSPQDVARLVRQEMTATLGLELERLATPIGYAPAGA